jgi:hypothetical protein
MDFTSLESESQIMDFSVWVANMGKPEVTSPLLFLYFTFLVLLHEVYLQIGGSIRRKIHGFFQRS